jgi:hypothetical protein
MQVNRAEQLPPNRHEINQEHRVRTDTISWSAEMLNGSMRTPTFKFEPYGEDLYGEDGGSLTQVFNDAITDARSIAQARPDLSFGVRRSLIERGELDDILCMVKGGPNTMVVISDYPPELMECSESKLGFNGDRKQTMLRVIARQLNGVIDMVSQSLDGSNRQALEAIYRSLRATPEPGELLGQRRKLDLPSEWQQHLIDNLMNTYDASLRHQFGGNWHAGIKQPDTKALVNTYEFAERQHDLIDWFTNKKLHDPIGAEKLRYQFAATMTFRYESGDAPVSAEQTNMISYLGVTAGRAPGQLMVEIERANQRAKFERINFNGCGLSLVSEASTSDQIEQLGYGGGNDKFGSLSFECPKGHKNTRERNKLLDNCRTCGVSVRC